MANTQDATTAYVANDTGYGYLKGYLEGSVSDLYTYVPTTLAQLTNASQYPRDIVPFNSISETEKDEYFDNILNHQYVSFDDPELPQLSNFRYLIGQNAYDQSKSTEVMSTSAAGGKAGQEKTYAFMLSALAYKRVADEYKNNKDSFDFNGTLKVTVELMLTALPISESQTDEAVEAFKNKYLKGTHTVRLHDFKDCDLKVEITFKRLEVTREGLISKMALYNAAKFGSLVEHVQKQLDKDYPDKHYDALTLLRALNMILIDIGSGTTDIVKFINGQVMSTSMSLTRGFDSVLNDARIHISNKYNLRNGLANAHELDSFLNKKIDESFSNQFELQNIAAKEVEIEANTLSDIIFENFRDQMKDDALNMNAIVVSGGGANGMGKNSNLKERMIQESNQYGISGIPVIWIGESDPTEATNLNAYGLKAQLDMMKKQK